MRSISARRRVSSILGSFRGYGIPFGLSAHPQAKVPKNEKGDYLRRKCVVCKRKSMFCCEGCDVGLHPECYVPYHE